MSRLLSSPFNLRILCRWIVCSKQSPREKAVLTGKGLNKTLTRFYRDHGRFLDPDDWLEKNPYHEAFFDDKEDWMNN